MPAATMKPDAGKAAPTSRVRETTADPTPGRFRLVDILFMIYFGANSLLLLHPNRPDNWASLLGLHLVYLIGIPLATRLSSRARIISLLRDWYPILGLTALYKELQFLNQILVDGYYDAAVIRWELALFGRHLCVHLREWLPWKVVGEAVHFGYFSYYACLPALFLPLWLSRRYREFRISMGVVGGTFVFCYFWYVYFPVTGPYWQDIPRAIPDNEGWFFPQLTNRIVSSGSSPGSAFPSSHIAASVAILGMAGRYFRVVYRILLVPVILLCIGTMYGGFHYGVDAIAGLVVGLLAVRYGPGLVERFHARSG